MSSSQGPIRGELPPPTARRVPKIPYLRAEFELDGRIRAGYRLAGTRVPGIDAPIISPLAEARRGRLDPNWVPDVNSLRLRAQAWHRENLIWLRENLGNEVSQEYEDATSNLAVERWDNSKEALSVLRGDIRSAVSRLRSIYNRLHSQAARDALLAWLYDQRKDPPGAFHIDSFLTAPRNTRDGQAFSPSDIYDAASPLLEKHKFSASDIYDAASYLQEKHLIKGTGIDQRRGPVIAWITASGVDCIEQGAKVAEYVQRPAKTTINNINSVSGTNIAFGDYNTQQARITNTSDLRQAVQKIIHALPDLNLDASQDQQAMELAADLLTEIDNPSDDRKLTRVTRQLRGLIATSARTALSATLTALIDAGLTKAGLPPGSSM